MDSREKLAASLTLCVLLWTASIQALTITGQVFDAQAQPVQAAEVVVIADHIEGKRISPVVTTDSAGRFQMKADASGCDPASVVVVARKTGYACAWDRLRGATIEGCSLLVLETPCACIGQVVDPDGKPVANAKVQAMAVRGPKEWFTTATNSQGRFRFDQFSAGVQPTFSIEASGWSCPWELTGDYSGNGFGAERSGIRLRLPREVAVRGRVVDDRGRFVSGVDLKIGPRSVKDATVKSRRPLLKKTRSDSKGEFAFEGLVEGVYDIGLDAPAEGLAPWAGKDTEVSIGGSRPVETTVRVGAGAIMEVTVLDAQTGRPVTDAEGHVFADGWGLSARADARGVIRLRVPSGASQLRVAAGKVNAPEYREWHTAGQVAEGQTVRIPALLPPLPSNRMISGTVTDDRSRPVEGIVVNMAPGEQTVTGKDGRFTAPYSQLMKNSLMRRVKPWVWVRDESRGLAGIALVESPAKPVSLTLSPVPTLLGRIVDPNGNAIIAARVSSLLFGGDALTDRDGRFELRAIPRAPEDRDHYLQVTASGFGPTRKRISPAGQSEGSADTGVIRLLAANESISGIVVDARGRPAPHIPVIAYALITNEPPDAGARGTAITNEKGEFSVGGLTKGAASVQGNFPGAPEGMGSLITAVPAQDLRVILGRDLWGEASLLGKPLPDPSQLCSDLVQFKADGKPILVCFGDIRGERYRQLLPKLATKMKALAAKDVAVIMLQYAKVNPTQYQAFINANALPFPIYVVEGDFEAKKIPWCVKSGNWLILADRQHIVRAEHLEIDRLEEAIAQLK